MPFSIPSGRIQKAIDALVGTLNGTMNEAALASTNVRVKQHFNKVY